MTQERALSRPASTLHLREVSALERVDVSSAKQNKIKINPLPLLQGYVDCPSAISRSFTSTYHMIIRETKGCFWWKLQKSNRLYHDLLKNRTAKRLFLTMFMNTIINWFKPWSDWNFWYQNTQGKWMCFILVEGSKWFEVSFYDIHRSEWNFKISR